MISEESGYSETFQQVTTGVKYSDVATFKDRHLHANVGESAFVSCSLTYGSAAPSASECKDTFLHKYPRCRRRSPLLPPLSHPQQNSAFNVSPNPVKQKSWDDQRVEIIRSSSLHCSAYQICSLIEFPTHALTSALMSPSPR